MSKGLVVFFVAVFAVLGLCVLCLWSLHLQAKAESDRLREAFDRLLVSKSQQERDDLWLMLCRNRLRLVVDTEGKVVIDRSK